MAGGRGPVAAVEAWAGTDEVRGQAGAPLPHAAPQTQLLGSIGASCMVLVDFGACLARGKCSTPLVALPKATDGQQPCLCLGYKAAARGSRPVRHACEGRLSCWLEERPMQKRPRAAAAATRTPATGPRDDLPGVCKVSHAAGGAWAVCSAPASSAICQSRCMGIEHASSPAQRPPPPEGGVWWAGTVVSLICAHAT